MSWQPLGGPALSFRLTPPSPSREPIALNWEEQAKSRAEITRWGAQMKKLFLLGALVIFGAILVRAGNKPHSGTIISENSVACCSTLEKGKKNKQPTLEVLCHHHFTRTPATDT